MIHKAACVIALTMTTLGCSLNKDIEPATLKFDEKSFTNESISKSIYSLSESAEVAANAQRALAKIANGMAATQMTVKQFNEYSFQATYTPIGMERHVGDINFSGQAIPLLRLVVEMAGYSLAEPAHKPIFEPTIYINTIDTGKSLNIIEVIRMIESSNKDSLYIGIDEENKIVSINYIY